MNMLLRQFQTLLPQCQSPLREDQVSVVKQTFKDIKFLSFQTGII